MVLVLCEVARHSEVRYLDLWVLAHITQEYVHMLEVAVHYLVQMDIL